MFSIHLSAYASISLSIYPGSSLGVIYLDKCTDGGCCCSCGVWRKFYQNRLARILPVFYFCNCLAVPLVWLGWGEILRKDLVSAIIATLIPVYTWTAFAFGSAFEGPGWTISTLLFFLYPSLASERSSIFVYTTLIFGENETCAALV